MSGSSQDLPRTLLPLTSHHRDEIDQTVLKVVGTGVLETVLEDEGANAFTTELSRVFIMTETIATARQLLKREHLKDPFDADQSPWVRVGTIQHHPELRGIIRHACQTHSFSHIADLDIFQTPRASDPTAPSAQDEHQSDFLYNSFSRPYVGKAVDGFYEYLKNNNMKFAGSGDKGPYFAKFCSIVQSSGTGKSRLMTELRNKGVLVLYMNIRERSDAGFPMRDVVPARILTEDMGCTQAEYTARCCAFFTAIFQTLQQDLDSSTPPRTHSQAGGPDPVIKSWNDEMCDMRSEARTKFFQRVQSQYQETLGKITIPTEKLEYGEIMAPKFGGQSFVEASYYSVLEVLRCIFKGNISTNDPKLVIAIDEAYPLNNMSIKGFRPSHIVGKTIHCYSKNSCASVWVVFASTTPLVADFSVPQVIHNSLRVAVAGQLVYPPYTHLGWDQLADPLSNISANDVAKFSHIVGFGRPLWRSLAGKFTITEIVTLAAQKLCKSMTFDLTDTNQALAILSQRFSLDICFGHPDAVSYLEKAVASHLRICFSTTEDRMWTFTGYPSEPLLSCVASILLHRRPDSLSSALAVLKRKVDGGMVEIGQSGGLASRLLLLLAKDLFIRKDPSRGVIKDILHSGNRDADLIDCQKVPVINFLEYLFGETFWLNLAEAKAAFQHAYINFSHWVAMSEFISPQVSDETDADPLSARCSAEEWTLRHWHRTSAVQCCHLQPLVDKMIPIYFDDPALGSEDIKRVSQIFISDTAGKNSNVQLEESGYSTRKHDTIQCQSNLPYIALLLDFNVSPQLSATFAESGPGQPETDQCLRIYASGMSSTIFSFLDEYCGIVTKLSQLVSQPIEAPLQRNLQGLVKFGSSARLRNSQWEAQDA